MPSVKKRGYPLKALNKTCLSNVLLLRKIWILYLHTDYRPIPKHCRLSHTFSVSHVIDIRVTYYVSELFISIVIHQFCMVRHHARVIFPLTSAFFLFNSLLGKKKKRILNVFTLIRHPSFATVLSSYMLKPACSVKCIWVYSLKDIIGGWESI